MGGILFRRASEGIDECWTDTLALLESNIIVKGLNDRIFDGWELGAAIGTDGIESVKVSESMTHAIFITK